MTQVVLLSPTGSNQTYTSDPSWNNNNNSVEVVGAGGAGAHGASTSTGGGGGAGGGYNKISNFPFANPGTTTATFQIGAAGLHGGTLTGGDTWFNAAAFPSSGTAVGAKGGPGPSSATSATGGTAVATTSFFPTTSPPARAGGNAANGVSATAGGGGGGGGGPNGAGGNASGTAGGTGDGGTVAAGAAGNPGTSFVGTEWTTAGVGGGAGASNASGGTGGTAKQAGGGGGGGSRSTGIGGDGGAGIIILTWAPVEAFFPSVILKFTPTTYPPPGQVTLRYLHNQDHDPLPLPILTATPGVTASLFVVSTPPQFPRLQGTLSYYWNRSPDFVAAVVETNVHFIGRYVAPAYARFNYNSQDTSTPQAETNTAFLGRHAPTAHVVRRAYLQNYPTADVVAETNVHSLGRFTPTLFAILPSLRQNIIGDPPPAQPETNVSTLGRFASPKLNLLPAYRQNPAADQPAETNTNFLGRYQAPVLVRFAYNSWDTGTPQVETNVHFVGRFTPTQFAVPAALRQNPAVDVPAAPADDPVHTLGRFTSPQLAILPLLRSNSATEVISQPETNVHFLGRYVAPAFARFAYNAWDTGVPQSETNPHFLGRYVQTQIALLPALRQNAALDVPPDDPVHTVGRFAAPQHRILAGLRQTYPAADVVAETNVHFLGRFAATTFSRPFAYSAWDTGVPQVETNVHFIGRFAPARPTLLASLRQNSANDVQTVVAETNVHTLGVFRAPVHQIRPDYRQAYPTADVVRETNVHTLGRFNAPQHSILSALRQSAALDFPPSAEPHFVGRHKQATFVTLQGNRQNYPSADTVAETNTHTVGRFGPVRFAALTAWRQNQATDVPAAAVAETNVHFLGVYRPNAYQIQIALRQNYPTADRVAETNPHTIGRFRSLQHFVSPSLRQNPALDPAPSTEPHFLGRYIAPQHRLQPQHRQDVPFDVVAETNPHFLGRHSPTRHVIVPGLRQTVPSDIIVVQPDTPVHTLGRHVPTRFSILQALFRNPAFDVPPAPPTQFGLAFNRDFGVYFGADADAPAALAMAADAPVWSAPAQDVTTEPGATCEATDSAPWKVMASAIGTYQIDSSVMLQGSFTGSNGQNADPTTITLYLEDPGGNESTFGYPSGPVVRAGIGFYTYTFTPAISGMWTYKWQGTGAVVATSPDAQFEVQPSALIPG